MLGSALITWNSKLQLTPALSSCEAEYMALAAAAQEAVWIRLLLQQLFELKEISPTIIKEDNQGCILLTKTTKHHSRTKHIDVRHHYIRSCIKENRVKVEYCPTKSMLADMFTKSLPSPLFFQHRAALLIIDSSIQSRGSVGNVNT